jgi:amylosucrase
VSAIVKHEGIKSFYTKLYGQRLTFDSDYQALIDIMSRALSARKPALKTLDRKRSSWFFSNKVVGMTLYVDLFSGSLKSMTSNIDYFKALGITFIHLMPLLKPRPGENDGGYAVMDYREINDALGTMDQFILLVDAFRDHGINVCIDYVINHVAKEHAWAQDALKGDLDSQAMFIMFDDDVIPKQYDLTVPEVLPDKFPGNFTYVDEIKKFVFTSFADYQWDLDFKNPKVFNGMVDNLLYLANLGVNMIRLDAIPFMWKTLGTTCRNLPQIHDLMHLFRLIVKEVAPSVALLGEAIVEPVEIVKYFGTEKTPEADVMYNASLMVDIYHAFATRDVRLLTIDANLYQMPQKSTWMNYVRCHDDIGWGFNEDAIRAFGLDPWHHKQFLIHFYNNDHPGTFASGEYYQYNPRTLDARTNGTLASLLGLEKAHHNNEAFNVRTAIDRINLAHALILSYRGFPLIYSGDEIATLNDHTYLENPEKRFDGRWIHRPHFDWKRAQKRDVMGTDEYHVFQTLKRLIKIRKTLPYLDGRAIQFALDMSSKHVLCLVRRRQNKTFFALFNMSEHPQIITTATLRQHATASTYKDVTQGRRLDLYGDDIQMSPYEYLWCVPDA